MSRRLGARPLGTMAVGQRREDDVRKLLLLLAIAGVGFLVFRTVRNRRQDLDLDFGE